MAAVGKIQAAWAAASNETTLALANLNFDFSLIKVEAPIEYQGLGAALSTRRRSAAEHGVSHSTARKLGALFEQIVPSTPHLFKAYGKRSSDIAKSPKVNPKDTKAYGPFAEYAGIDGTSIWAAATSGSSALAIHLLACMLARIWSPSEATGVWAQIIAVRKQQLLQFSDQGSIQLQSLAAAQLSLTTEQLADWDANARAWLRAADIVEELRQKQLSLIIQSLNISITQASDVYTSVMQAWKTAMTTMDRLISGMGHSIQDGSTLLGLSSWHLYPDLVVLGNKTAEVKQKDSLVAPGGIVTIGLQGAQGADDCGVHWSLSLAHVHFYGDPVPAEGSISLSSSRVSLDEFLLVVFGSLISTWSPNASDVDEWARMLIAMWQSCKELSTNGNWLQLLADTSERYLTSDNVEKEAMIKLIRLGQRHARFFGNFKGQGAILGLTLPALLKLMKDREAQVYLLRKAASTIQADRDTLIIRLSPQNIGSPSEDRTTVFATALPKQTEGPVNAPNMHKHIRWQGRYEVDRRQAGSAVSSCIYEEEVQYYNEESIESLEPNLTFSWTNPPDFFTKVLNIKTEDYQKPKKSRKPGIWGRDIRNNNQAVYRTNFNFCCGDPEGAAIFSTAQRIDGISEDKILSARAMTDLFSLGCVDGQKFLRFLSRGMTTPMEQLSAHIKCETDARCSHDACPPPCLGPVISLKAVATIVEIYKQVSNMKIPLGILAFGPFTYATWIPRSAAGFLGYGDQCILLPFQLSRAQKFSCIAMIESEGLNLDPVPLLNVFAISMNDSIYVAAPLLCDPSVYCGDDKIQRIAGNVGKAGLALLINPSTPKIKQLGVGSYHLINHVSFDGKVEDNFRNTSLHLGLTGYELPVDIGTHGSRSRQAFFLESVVSVHDRGEWVADLDIRGFFSKGDSLRSPLKCNNLDHVRSRNTPFASLVSIDSWEELLETPFHVGIVRAHKNWVGRLAATAVSIRLGHPTIILDGASCWTCTTKHPYAQFPGRNKINPQLPTIYIC